MLTDRTFRVRFGDTLFPSFDQVGVVPKGSVLSVLCFTLAVYDIVIALDEVRCSLFVYNFVIYLSSSTLPSAIRRMQLAINRVADWTDFHRFRFSVEKSHVVLSLVFPEPFFTLYGRPLSVVREVRILGMIFDERLTWAPHLGSSYMSKSS